MNLRPVTAMALLLSATMAFAQSTETGLAERPTSLPEYLTVEKSGGRDSLTSPSAASADEQKKALAGGFTLRTPDRLNRGRASNFQDLLGGTPGLFLQSESGAEVTKVSIRGSGILSEDEPLGVQFLLDGITLNQADGEVILEDFDLSLIKYAEVFRGADALRYGSLTLGGAINLVSKTGHDADRFAVRAEGGSYGYWRGQATVGGVKGSMDYIGSAMGRRRDGFRDHSREELDRFTFNLGNRLSPRLENRVYLTLDRSERALPGPLSQEDMYEDSREASDEALEQDFNKKSDLIRVANKLTFVTEHHRLEAGVFWFHRNMEERGFFTPDFRQGITAFHSNNYGVVVNSVTKSELFGRQNTLTVGANAAIEREATTNYENLEGIRGAPTARNHTVAANAPLYLEDHLQVTNRLSVLGGLQLVYARREFKDHFLSDDQGDQSHDQTFHGVSPKAGLIYAINEAAQVFTNLSRSWQPPSFDNMVEFEEGTNSSLVYRPLQPQRAWTLELGTRGHHGPWEWELSVYHSRLRNELVELNDAQGHEIGAVNLERSRHRGIEAGLEVELLELFGITRTGSGPKDRLSLNQSYTLNDFRFRDDPVYGNNRIAGIPLHVYEAELLYEARSGIYLGANLQYIPTDYAVDQANTLFANSYSLLGVKVGFNHGKRLSVFVELKNVLNKQYASSVDPIAEAEEDEEPEIFHPGEGRAIYAGVSWAW